MKTSAQLTAVLMMALLLMGPSCKRKPAAPAATAASGQAQGIAEKPAPQKKIMYRSTMMPNEVSDKPGKDSMGMDMVPFEVEGSGTVQEVQGRIRVKISPERQQLIGVRTAVAGVQPIERVITAVGEIDYAEPNISVVNLKYDGWVERLSVDRTGLSVRRGAALLDLYSPDLVAAEQEYLIALKSGPAFGNAEGLLRSAREKLALWNLTDAQIADLARTGQPRTTITVYAPASGIVVEKNVLLGQKIMAGEDLFKIVDLTRVWILGEIYESEVPFVRVGQTVEISLASRPGEAFSGRIAYIYPYLKPETRTNQIRIEAANPALELKPRMYANLRIRVGLGRKLAIPVDSVLDAGVTKVVFVVLPDGYFEPREVKLGVSGENLYEVLDGVREGESVVTSANFLVDSESSLKAALGRMIKTAPGDAGHD